MRKKITLCLLIVVALYTKTFSQQTSVNQQFDDDFASPVFNPIFNQFNIQWSHTIKGMSGELITVGHTWVSGQGENIYLIKRDPDGNIIWQTDEDVAGNGFNDYGINLWEASNGDIYVCGTTDNGGSTNYDGVIMRFNSSGSLVSSTTYPGGSGLNDIATALRIHPTTGNLIVALTNENSGTSYDYLVLEVDPNNLTVLNSNNYDGANLIDVVIGIEIDAASGDISLIGGSQSSIIESAYAVATFNSSLAFATAARTDLVGTPYDQPLAYIKDASNNIYITGKTLSGTTYDVRTVKINANNTIAWNVTLDVNGLDDIGTSIALDPVTGNVIVGGLATRSGNITDMLCVKYNGSNGSQIGTSFIQKSENTSGNAAIKKLCVNSTGNIYFIAGESANTGNKQVVVGKILSSGTPSWQKKVNNLNDDVLPSDIRWDTDGIYTMSILDSVTDSYRMTKFDELVLDTTRTYVNGQARWKTRELVVSFMPNAINKAEIDNQVGTKRSEFGNLSDYLTTSAMNSINASLERYCSECNIKAIKIFESFKSTDTTDISRTGEIVPIPPFWSMLLLQLPPSVSISQAATAFKSLPNVVSYSHPNYFVTQVASPPNDSLYATDQPNLHPTFAYPSAHINVEDAWNVVAGCGSEHIKCGLFDTGVEWQHKDFGFTGSPTSGKVQGWDFSWYNSYNMNLRNTTTPDMSNHGTRTAGIIGAIRNNTSGIAGIAGGDGSNGNSGVPIYSLKVFQTTAHLLIKSQVEAVKSGTALPYNYGIDFATCNYLVAYDAGYTVDTVASLIEAIHYMNRMQVPCVAARGNWQNYTYFPACFDTSWVISVGGTGNNGQYQSPFSWGQGIDVAAPSHTSIVKSTNTALSYEEYNGTSAATPHVAGVVGLMLSYMNDTVPNYNNMAPEDCDYIIQRSATDVGPAGYDSLTGYGRLNAGRALRMIEKPVRILYHYGTNYRFPYIISKSVYSNFDTIKLTETYRNNLNQTVYNKGKYIVKTYQIDANVTHAYTYPTDSLMHIWPRHSASYVFDLPDNQKRMNMHERVKIVSYNSTSADLRGYIYEVKDSTGTPIGWWPCDTSFNALYVGFNKPKTLMEYSLLTKNKAVGISEHSKKHYNVNVFPNPTSGKQSLVFESEKESACTVELYDLMGRFIRVVYNGRANIGKTTITHDLSGLPNSMYIYIIKLDDKTLNTKFIKE